MILKSRNLKYLELIVTAVGVLEIDLVKNIPKLIDNLYLGHHNYVITIWNSSF
jgi:hypothetical protein